MRATFTLLILLMALTAASIAYNGATRGRRPPPAGQQYLQAADVLTRYRSWGRSGSPVVLVHGAAESADTWSGVGPLLGRDHRVYALDLDGWGYSRRRPPFTGDHQVTQLLGFLSELGLRRPILVGHSSGAAIVAEAALRRPDAVGGVLFLDGDALATGAGQRSWVTALVIPPYRTTLLRLALRSDGLIRAVYDRACGPRCPPLDRAGVDVWRHPFQVPGAEAGLFAMLRGGVPGVPIPQLTGLAALPMPKAVVFGADDTVFSPDTPVQTAQRIGAPPPTLIPQARHLTMISDPGPVAAAVQALAARLPGRSG